MLETVRSRRIYGAGITLVLPACAAVGYYLRTRHENDVAASTAQLVAAAQPARPLSPADEVALLREQAAVEERIRMLRRDELLLDAEAKDLADKLNRVKERTANKTV